MNNKDAKKDVLKNKSKKKYQDGGMVNTASSLSPILKDAYSSEKDDKKIKKEILSNMSNKFKDGGTKKDKMPCNKPKREKKGSNTHVVKGCQNGEEKLVRFGHSMPDGTNDPERKKSYCARSKGIKSDSKLKANYWSRKNWKCNN